MRINRLALKNLNSLRGEFQLDFEATPLAEAGIFAITGPTGAGKTTILDAICVALYGQTPRLAAGSSGELLSRNTGECFAEVEFTVALGRFRSRWSRRRARNRADGNLQPTAMELIAIDREGEGERIIEDQVRQVIERVEALTGLDFGRFTRSVMLAQGSFASFLKAKENERAELLERMTGTRIYSFISMAAFNRARDERARLDELVAINAHLDLIPPEQLAELEGEAAALEVGIKAQEEALAGLRAEEAMAARFAALTDSIRLAEEGLAAVSAEQEAAGPELSRLARAEAVRPLQGELLGLDSLERECQALQAEAAGLGVRGERLRAEQETARAVRLVLEQEAACFAEAAAVREGAIAEAERLDQQLRHHQEAHAARRRTISGLEDGHTALAAECRGRQEGLTKDAARIEALELVLGQRAIDAGLGQSLSLLAERLQELSHHRDRFTDNRRQQERVGLELTRLGRECDRLLVQQAEAEAALAALRGRVAEGEAALADILQGRTSEGLEQEVTADRERLARLTALLGLLEEQGRLTRELADREDRIQELTRGLAEARTTRQQLRERKLSEEELLALLEERQVLAARVAGYEADRLRLTRGEPCPLCGGVDHPWLASGTEGPPLPEEGRAAVIDHRLRLEGLVRDLGGIDQQVREREQTATALTEERATLARTLAGVEARLAEQLAEAGVSAPDQILAVRSELEGKIEGDQARLVATRRLRTEVDGLFRQLMAAEKGGVTVVVELEKGLALLQTHQESLARAQVEAEALCRRGTELSAALTPRLAEYGVALPGPGQEEGVGQLLRERWQRYDETREERASLETRLAEERRLLAVSTTRLTGVREQLAREGEAVREIAGTIELLRERRRALLREETTEAARQRLVEERALLEARLAESEQARTGIATQLATQGELSTTIKGRIERLAAEAGELTRTLVHRGEALGLADLAALRQALLPEAEFAALTERREGLTLRQRRFTERGREAREGLAALGEAAARLDREAIAEAMTRVVEELARRQQGLGARRERIRRQHELAREHRERAEAIAQQRVEQHRWQLLSDLVGSADGKKFRRFAQGLTLDHLINLANRQLVRLTDRYLLRRHQAEELGLEIMDTYQADAIRPTGTLSGGEEFLVSLALALGLANLAGQTRIDSLFLDEGFGALDTDTLETALSALAALQESGKTIGIISHVDALKERIPVQIRLQKLAGGFSAMTVSG